MSVCLWGWVQCGSGFHEHWIAECSRDHSSPSDTTASEWGLHNCTQLYIPHFVSWTHIHQSVAIPLHSSLFLKVHSHGMGTPSHPAEWERAEHMSQHLGDLLVLTLREQWSLTPSWLIQLCWSLVSRTHSIVQYTGLCVHWHCPTVWINWIGP